MGRKILGVVVGFLVSAVWVFATLSLAWVALGSGFAWEEGSTRTSTGWTLLMLASGFVGAVLAGWVAAAIGKSRQAAIGLAVVILVLALALAIFNLTLDREAKVAEVLAGRQPAELPMMEAASVSLPPAWYDWVIGLVGAAGAVLGGRLWGRRAGG